MHRFKRQFLASTALMMLVPASAFAELSAEDVWTEWTSYFTNFGYQISGQQDRAGNTLTITGVQMRTSDDTPGSVSIDMDKVVLTEQADGTVTVALPSLMPMVISTPNDTGGVTRVSMDYRHAGLSILASGTPDAMRHDYAADQITLETTGFEVNGEVLPAQSNAVQVTLETLKGQTDMTRDTQRTYDQTLNVGSVRYSVDMADAKSGEMLDMTGQAQRVRFEGSNALPLQAAGSGDMSALLASGFAADGTFTYAANALQMETAGGSGPFSGSFLSDDGSVAVSLGENGLTYDVTQNGLSVDMTSPQIPLPVTFAVAQSAFNITMPLRQSDEARDFALGISLNGFSMSDLLWGLFDPTGQLPRDPATIAVDLAGKARLLFDFLDPGAAMRTGPKGAPAEIETLDINNLQISAAGAELTGQGAFDFDNSTGGAPQPEGAVDLTLKGGNGLIDKLVAIGILPEQQAIGARMMMGLLAIPGTNPDTLSSKIEVNKDGHVIANGQRIR